MYNEGVSKTGDVLDLGVNYGILEKAGAFIKYNGETLGQGREAVKRLFKEKPELMNEIEADVAGRIVEVLVNDGEPVEYGMPLFAIE